MKKAIALMLVLATLLALLASCDGGGDVVTDGGDRVGDSWDGVDFKGQEVKMCISTNQYEECLFPAADIYTKGPDKAGSNEVAKAVLARNARASEEIGINIVYTESDLKYPDVLGDIEKIVRTSSKNSPDIYNNDLIGLAKAMVNGYLWNVNDPGDDVKNYFDFKRDGWYQDFIKGCTFDQNKIYVFAGDYFIDMIRMAWVIYVNEDLYTQNAGKLPQWAGTLTSFYTAVEDGDWDMDDMATICGAVFTEGEGGVLGVTDREDKLIGLAVNHTTDWVMANTSGVSVYYQDKKDGYKPKVIESENDFKRISDKYIAMVNTKGVINDNTGTTAAVLETTKIFLEGKTVFAVSRLGEMESDGLRDASFAKGLVPFPKWNKNEQRDYHTVIHNQVELGGILNTAKAYSAASALMQFLNEESEDVVYTYYERGLKYKYNDNKNARAMMDIVRENADSPFGFFIGDLCYMMLYQGAEPLQGLLLDKNATLSSTFAAEKDSYVDCLNKMMETFANLD